MPIIESWTKFDLNRCADLVSPCLLIDRAAVKHNVNRMLNTLGDHPDPERLRPHVKTHKSTDVVGIQAAMGIKAFKTATIAEAQMSASAGANDVLVAHAPVQGKARHLAVLASKLPAVRFRTIVDHPRHIDSLGEAFSGSKSGIGVLIDVDCGMHRTGIPFGRDLRALRDKIQGEPSLTYDGLHVYDGHLQNPSLDFRTERVHQIFQEILDDLQQHRSSLIVVGGSPTFPVWSRIAPEDGPETRWQFSPGTVTLWDTRYAEDYADMEYQIAACVLTRVISRPGDDLLCLDLGTKSIASEMPIAQRVRLPAIPDAEFVKHSEEHLVVRCPHSQRFDIGTSLVAFPRHICPTVARYRSAALIGDDGTLDKQCAIASGIWSLAPEESSS